MCSHRPWRNWERKNKLYSSCPQRGGFMGKGERQWTSKLRGKMEGEKNGKKVDSCGSALEDKLWQNLIKRGRVQVRKGHSEKVPFWLTSERWGTGKKRSTADRSTAMKAIRQTSLAHSRNQMRPVHLSTVNRVVGPTHTMGEATGQDLAQPSRPEKSPSFTLRMTTAVIKL